MAERFPGIDWYCDKCGAYLNAQANFDDHKYIWKCTKCGYKNSISSADIVPDAAENPVLRTVASLLGLLRSFGLYSAVASALAFFGVLALGAFDLSRLFLPIVIAYAALIVASLFFERGVCKYGREKKLPLWIATSIVFYILDDVARPFKEAFGAIASIVRRASGRQCIQFASKVTLGILYILLVLAPFAVVLVAGILGGPAA